MGGVANRIRFDLVQASEREISRARTRMVVQTCAVKEVELPTTVFPGVYLLNLL